MKKYRSIIESELQNQQESQVNYEKKQVKTMECHAKRNKDVGDVMFEKAKQREAEGDVEGSIDAYSEAGHNYIKASEKIVKSEMVANGKEDYTFEQTYTKDGKEYKRKKKAIKEHSIEKANEALGNNALISKERAHCIDRITGYTSNSYIELQYGNKKCDVVSLNGEQALFLKESTEEIFARHNDKKEKYKKKKKKEKVKEWADKYFDEMYK